MSWGIVYPPYSILNMGGNPPPQTRWVYNFNGVDSYIQLSPISYLVGDLITFKVLFNSVQPIYTRLVGGNIGNGEKIQFDGTGSRIWQGSATYEVVSVDGGAPDKVVTDGSVHVITVRIKQPVVYSIINSNNPSSNSSYFTGFLFDYTDSLGNNLPINDRTFGDGAPIANSATVLGSNLWGGQNLAVANIGVVTTVVSGEAWDISSSVGSPSNNAFGARVISFSGLTDGEQYLYDVDSSEPVNIAVYNTNYQLISGGTVENGKGILFTHNGTSRVYVCPRTTNTVRVSNGRVRLANGYATGVNLLESGWTEINT